MPWPIIAALGASALGGLIGGGDQKQSTSPDFGKYGSLADTLYKQYAKSMGGGTGWAENALINTGLYTPKDSTAANLSGYHSSGVSNINEIYDILGRQTGNNLTARGLSDSPVAGLSDQLMEIERGKQIADFTNQMPLLQRQFQQEDQNNALNFLRTISGQQTVQGGNQLASMFSDTGSMLGWLMGQGILGGGKNQSTPSYLSYLP
jgi:hypothetical protein